MKLEHSYFKFYLHAASKTQSRIEVETRKKEADSKTPKKLCYYVCIQYLCDSTSRNWLYENFWTRLEAREPSH